MAPCRIARHYRARFSGWLLLVVLLALAAGCGFDPAPAPPVVNPPPVAPTAPPPAPPTIAPTAAPARSQAVAPTEAPPTEAPALAPTATAPPPPPERPSAGYTAPNFSMARL